MSRAFSLYFLLMSLPRALLRAGMSRAVGRFLGNAEGCQNGILGDSDPLKWSASVGLQ